MGSCKFSAALANYEVTDQSEKSAYFTQKSFFQNKTARFSSMYFENVISYAKCPQPLVYKQTASFQNHPILARIGKIC